MRASARSASRLADYIFEPIYWSDDHSSEVIFEPIRDTPPSEMVSACFVFAVKDDSVVLVRPKRGWGLPGGHREESETPEECLRREALEEALVKLKNITLVGRWKIEKKFESELNKKYPPLAYQLLYVADVAESLQFTAEHEILERAFVPVADIPDVISNYDNFKEIFRYILENRGRDL